MIHCKTHLYMSVLQQMPQGHSEARGKDMMSSTQGHAVTASGDGGTVLEMTQGTQRAAGLSLLFPAALLYSAANQCCWHSCSTMPRPAQCAQSRLSHPKSDGYGLLGIWCMISSLTGYPSYDHFCFVTLLFWQIPAVKQVTAPGVLWAWDLFIRPQK